MEEDFFTNSQSWKKVPPRPEIKMLRMRIGCHSSFKTLTSSGLNQDFAFKWLSRAHSFSLSLFVHVHFCRMAETAELSFESTELTRYFSFFSFFMSYTT